MREGTRRLQDFRVATPIRFSLLWASLMSLYIYNDYFSLRARHDRDDVTWALGAARACNVHADGRGRAPARDSCGHDFPVRRAAAPLEQMAERRPRDRLHGKWRS
jgi:hypothetical protein